MATTDTLAAEYDALTQRCGLVDRSERGKLALTGAGAMEFLNGQVTNELADLCPGEGRYAAFLTHKGKMLGDLRILAVGERGTADGGSADGGLANDPEPAAHSSSEPVAELLLDTERMALQALFDMIRHYKLGYDVELHKRTLECGLLSLVGPDSRSRAAELVSVQKATPHTSPTSTGEASASVPPALPDAEHAHLLAEIAGTPVRLIATAEGIDVLCAAPAVDAVRMALLDAGITPVSEATAEIVRVEHGRPRFGVDIDDSTIPQEANLNERAVSFTKGCYVGQETVARLYYRGKPNRHLRGLRFAPADEAVLPAPAPADEAVLPAPAPADEAVLPSSPASDEATILGPVPAGETAFSSSPAPGEELRLGERTVGHVGSVVQSPRLGTIGLALVRREAAPGDLLTVGEHGTTAAVVELPFPARA